jgi:hypothetical protein
MFTRLLTGSILVILGLPGLALAEQIAQISEQIGQGNAYVLTDDYSVNGTEVFTVTNLPVYFSFSTDLDITIPNPVAQNESGLLNLSVTSTTAGGGYLTQIGQGGFTGAFSIIDNSGGVNNGMNLLSGTFSTSASIGGTVGGHGMTFSDTDTDLLQNEVTFTSSFLNFAYYTGTEVATFSLSNLQNVLALDTHNFLVSTTGAGTGTFSATPTPPVLTAEPETLLLSGAALLGIGLVLRKRKLQPVL